VAEGEGRKDDATGRLSGRAPDNRLVHFVPAGGAAGGAEPGAGHDSPRPGDVATVEVTYAAPHHLVADGPLLGVRRTAAGDVWERGQQEDACGAGAAEAGSAAVGLGLPSVPAAR
jgi:tRNA-2-methylthio-N6-dimethylallyladenosine synthase